MSPRSGSTRVEHVTKSGKSDRGESGYLARRVAPATSLLTIGLTIFAMGTLDQTRAQETKLPAITVEGGGGTKKNAQTAPAPKQAAKPAPAPASAPATAATSPTEAQYQTPAAVTSVGQGEIETFGQGGNIQNVLRSIPGVSTVDSPNNPGIAINIRGFEGSGRVNMMIDGVRQDFRFTGHEAQGFLYVDPLLLAGIDIQRGAVSTAGGAGALAGTANLRTLDVEDILKPGRDYGSLSSITWGSNGVGFSEMTSGAIRDGAIGIAGAISKHDQDDYKNGLGQTVPFTDQDLLSGLGKVHIQIDRDQRLSFGTVLYNNDFAADGYNQTIRSKIYTSNYIYKPTDNPLIDFRANFYDSDLTMHYLQAVDTTAVGLLFLPSAGRVIEDVGLGFDAANISRFNLGGGVLVKAEYGYEYFHDDIDASNQLDLSKGAGVNPSGTSSIGGVFSQTTISKSIFDAIIGLRYDTFNLDGAGVVPTLSSPFPGLNPVLPPFLKPGPYTFSQSEGGFSPKLTLAARPVEWFAPYVTYSESFRPPTVSETLAGGSHPGSVFAGIFLPNPFLQPEEQKGWEYGFNSRVNDLFQHGDTFRLKGDYYSMDVDNYVTSCFTDFGFGVFSIYFCNVPGISKVAGVELQGAYDAGYVFGGFTYTHTHTTLPSQQDGFGFHSYLPDDIATITGGVRLLDQKLEIGARTYITSKSFLGLPNITPDGSPFLPGYTTVDLFSSYKVTEDVTTALLITNLMDVAYTPALSTGRTGQISPSGATIGVPIETGRGRTFLLTTRAQF
jgi:hemoglobin/transferrin/lactoferrin receptor protein